MKSDIGCIRNVQLAKEINADTLLQSEAFVLCDFFQAGEVN
jgi:hypothetical protein